MYGIDNYLHLVQTALDEKKIIAVNAEKADQLLRSIEKSYLKENTPICYDNSIAYTTENVNYGLVKKECVFLKKKKSVKVKTLGQVSFIGINQPHLRLPNAFTSISISQLFDIVKQNDKMAVEEFGDYEYIRGVKVCLMKSILQKEFVMRKKIGSLSNR